MTEKVDHEGVDVLAVMDAEIQALPVMAAMASAAGTTCDATEAVARLSAVREAVAELIAAAKRAEAKLFAMSREFNSPRFTDRYGDGPEMRECADALTAALSRLEPQV